MIQLIPQGVIPHDDFNRHVKRCVLTSDKLIQELDFRMIVPQRLISVLVFDLDSASQLRVQLDEDVDAHLDGVIKAD